MPAPLRFQTKLLCFSLLYLFTTLFLALYTFLDVTKCTIVYQSRHVIPHPLFSYPANYGEHKYAVPTVRDSCASSVRFSDYKVSVEDVDRLCRNFSHSSGLLRFMEERANSFSGNFGAEKRKSYFDFFNNHEAIPCGFMDDFTITDADRVVMKNCDKVVLVSAVFGDHDKIRQPRGLGAKTLEFACFFMFIDNITFDGLSFHGVLSNVSHNMVGVWRIVKILGKLPYENPAMNGVIPKHLIHRLFPNSKFSIWLDAKMQLMVDPLLLIHSLIVKEDADMAISKHPFNIHTMEEAVATARWKKWDDTSSLRRQMETYCEHGLEPWTQKKLPYTTDVPDTALILRKHGLASNLFSCLLFNELEAFNPRDQLAFAYVRDLMNPKIKINMFESEVLEHITMEYRHNFKHVHLHSTLSLNKGWLELNSIEESFEAGKCSIYLSKIWEDSNY